MKGYDTSKDYKELKRLLDDGRMLIVLTRQEGELTPVLANLEFFDKILIYQVGCEMQVADDMSEKSFSKWMKDLKAEYVIPKY